MSEAALAVEIGQHSIAGRKPRNDDSYGVAIPAGRMLEIKGVAAAIADGMSSSEAAKEASECCVRTFLEDYYATHETWTVPHSVATVLKAVNGWLHAQGERHAYDERGMVSTFSGIVLKSGLAHLFHAGDTRIYRLRGGAIEMLTTDHRIKIGGGREHLSRAFGINHNLEIDYRREPLEQHDLFLFTSDGVHDHLGAQEMAGIIGAAPADLDIIAEKIVATALARGSADNLTCQLLRVQEPGARDATGFRAEAARLPFPQLPSPGDRIDAYTIVRPLSESSRSQVFLAREDGGSQVAIKTPSPNFEDDEAYIEAFAREEWIGRLVTSPNTLKSLEPAGRRTALYHVTEYFEGVTLQQWMADRPQPDFQTVRDIVAQIASGLRALHRKDILHLDLKPGNVMVDADGVVKIIDFGSSRAGAWVDGASDGREAAIPAGAVDYSAPEHLTGKPPANRSDIYSLGVIAYEMLTGQLPYGRGFRTRSDAARLAYVSAVSRRPDIPPWMDAALEQAVKKSPTERTDALSALVENLRKPNPALGYGLPKPLIERNPVRFWQGVSAILAAICVMMIVLWALTIR